MTATREHLAGLELAYESIRTLNTAAGSRQQILDLIEKAQSAPEPVQGGDFCDGHCTWLDHQPGCPRHGAVQGEAVEVAENTGSTTTNLTPTGGGAGSLPVEPAATGCEAGKGVEIFAWATFDGEGGYDLRLFENNERYMDDWLETNGARYARWVFPLYTAAAKPDAELVALRAEIEELDALKDRQSSLLSQAAIALRGPEPALTRYSHADIPSRVKMVVADLQELVALLRDAREGLELIGIRDVDYGEVYEIKARIDAKLAELQSCSPAE